MLKCFHSFFEFSQTFTSVSITRWRLSVIDSEKRRMFALGNKLASASLRFKSVCEEDLDEVLND